MTLFIDTEADDKNITEVLLSDNNWYKVKSQTHCMNDALEIGYYDSNNKKYYQQTDLGEGFAFSLKDGSVIYCRLSEIKAFKIEYKKIGEKPKS